MTGSGLEFKIDLMIRPNEGSVESAFQGLASGMCRRTRILVVSLASLFTTTFLNFFFWEIFDQDGFRQVLANSGLKPEGLASPEEAERVVGCSMGPLDIRWVVSLTMKYAWLIAHTACGSTPPVTTTDSTGAAMAMQQP